MKYSGKINYVKAAEWGLSPALCVLFDWMYDVPSWADHLIKGTDVYYFASRTKAVSDLVILTDKPDTMYRYYSQLKEKGLIEIKKIDGKDYIRLTEKAKEWDFIELGKISDNSDELPEQRKKIRKDSEKNPNKLGKISETDSEKNPTYYNITIDNSIKDNSIKDNKTNSNIKPSIVSTIGELEDVEILEEIHKKENSQKKKNVSRTLLKITYKTFIDIWLSVETDKYQRFDFQVNKTMNVGQFQNLIKAIDRDLLQKYGDYDEKKMAESVEAVLRIAYKYFGDLYDQKKTSVFLFEPLYVYRHYQKIKTYRTQKNGLNTRKMTEMFFERYEN